IGDPDGALTIYQGAWVMSEKLDEGLDLIIWLKAAQAAISAGKTQDALFFIKHILDHPSSERDLKVRSEALWLLFKIFRKEEPRKSFTFALDSIKTKEEILSKLKKEEDKVDYFSTISQRCEDAALFALQKDEPLFALEFMKRHKSRILSDIMAEKAEEFKEDVSTFFTFTDFCKLFDKYRKRGDNPIFVEYLAPPRSSIYIMLLGEFEPDKGITPLTIPLPIDPELNQDLDFLSPANWFNNDPEENFEVRSPLSTSKCNELLERLYQRIWAPVDKVLVNSKATRAVVIPHRKLHHVPFAALRSPDGYIAECRDYVLSFAPSLRALTHCAKYPSRKIESVFGIDMIPDRDEGSIPPIGLSWENMLARFPRYHIVEYDYKSEKDQLVLVNENGRKLIREFADCFPNNTSVDLAVFTGHGCFSPLDPFESALEFGFDENPNQNYKLPLLPQKDQSLSIYSLNEFFGRGFNAFVLSCNEATSLAKGVDEQIGIIRGFLAGGAKNVVGALWEVYSDVLNENIRELLDDLEEGIPSDQTVKEMQKRLIEKGNQYSHPAYWAGFQVYGWPFNRQKRSHK
ncbi:MAG: CHAT domain-containing protein, partial [Deltaproteobacteria bacterium]|nr:CHAT domain-containing protein [Deltaproteobacteria bacterium]